MYFRFPPKAHEIYGRAGTVGSAECHSGHLSVGSYGTAWHYTENKTKQKQKPALPEIERNAFNCLTFSSSFSSFFMLKQSRLNPG